MAAGRFACTQVLSHIVRGSNSLLSKSRSALPQQKRLISLASQAYQRYFTKDHEWIDVEGNVGIVGITDHAQAALGELVYVELPEVEDSFDQDDSVGAVESVKAASDVMTPVSGTIVAVNEDLTANPSLINKNAESDAWMFKIELSDADELSEMLDSAGYKAFVDAESG